MQFYRSSLFHCVEKNGSIQGEYYADGLLVINEGKVLEIGDYDVLCHQFPQEVLQKKLQNFPHHLIIPGLIDAHVHYPQYKVIASFGKTLLQWLNDYTFVEEQKFHQEDYAKHIAELFFTELLRNGTTTAMSFCTSHSQSVEAFFDIAQKYGMRMLGGKMMMDSHAPESLCDSVESSYNQSKKLIEKWHNKNRLLYSVSPRFALTSSSSQLSMAARLMREYNGGSQAKDGVRMQTHLNENTDEISRAKELYSQYENYFDIYDKHHLSGENSVFGHCIYCENEEFKRMAESGSKIALCPTSNLFLGSGLFNMQRLDEHNIPYAIASDVGGGDSFSLFKAMNEAYKIGALQGYKLDSIKALYLCTLGASKVLNLEHCLGNFEKGKEADFVALNLQATPLIYERIQPDQTIEELLFTLITLGDDRLVDKVYLLGEEIKIQ